MSDPQLYRIAPRVSHQTIDGEVIAITFEDGVYHSLRGSAAAVWEGIVAGASCAAIARAFVDAPAGVILEIEEFVGRLLTARLVEPDLDGRPNENYSPAAATGWTKPELETFTDLSQLLLADPIHDVGAEAWPALDKSPRP
jgi:hypothetical protein